MYGDAAVNFGGLVGRNLGGIIGCEQESGSLEDKIVLNSSAGRQNILSSIKINSELAGNSAIGGVVGFNNYSSELDDEGLLVHLIGTIKNGFIQANIDAKSTSNVGGVIGRNEQETRAFNLVFDGSDISIENSQLDAILSVDIKLF